MSAGAIKAGGAYVELFTKDKLDQGLSRAHARLQAFAGRASAIGSKLLSIGTAATVPAFLATRTFVGLSDQLLTLKGITTGTEAEFVRLTDRAKELGRTTSFTAAEVAGAMVALGRAGFSRTEIDQSIDGILNLSRATGTELPLAADIAGAALRGFGLDTGQANRVADVLTATTNSSAQTLEDLGEAVKYVAPLAAETGESIENVNAALAVLANNGIKGSLAGNAVARAYKNLSTELAQEKLRAVGVEAVDAAGNIRPLATVIAELGAATASLGNAERLALFEELFGRAQASALKLANAGANFTNLQQKLDQAAGSAAATAATMDSEVGGSLRRLLSAVEGIAIAYGTALSPALSETSDQLGTTAADLTAFISTHQGLMVALTAGIATTLTLGIAFKTLGFIAGGLSQGVALASGTLNVLRGVATLTAAAVARLTGWLAVQGIPTVGAWILQIRESVGAMSRMQLAANALKLALAGALAIGVWTAWSAAAQAELQATQTAVERMTSQAIAHLQRLREETERVRSNANENPGAASLAELQARRDKLQRERKGTLNASDLARASLNQELNKGVLDQFREGGLGDVLGFTGNANAARFEADIKNLDRQLAGIDEQLAQLDQAIAEQQAIQRNPPPPKPNAAPGAAPEEQISEAAAQLAQLVDTTRRLDGIGNRVLAGAAAGGDPTRTAVAADKLGGDLAQLAEQLRAAGQGGAADRIEQRAQLFDDLARSLQTAVDPRALAAAAGQFDDRQQLIGSQAQAGRFDAAATLADAAANAAEGEGRQLAAEFFRRQAEQLRQRADDAATLAEQADGLPDALARRDRATNAALELGSAEALRAIVSATSPEQRLQQAIADSSRRAAAAAEATARHSERTERHLADAAVVTAGEV